MSCNVLCLLHIRRYKNYIEVIEGALAPCKPDGSLHFEIAPIAKRDGMHPITVLEDRRHFRRGHCVQVCGQSMQVLATCMGSMWAISGTGWGSGKVGELRYTVV